MVRNGNKKRLDDFTVINLNTKTRCRYEVYNYKTIIISGAKLPRLNNFKLQIS